LEDLVENNHQVGDGMLLRTTMWVVSFECGVARDMEEDIVNIYFNTVVPNIHHDRGIIASYQFVKFSTGIYDLNIMSSEDGENGADGSSVGLHRRHC
jgi:hypothetical protein